MYLWILIITKHNGQNPIIDGSHKFNVSVEILGILMIWSHLHKTGCELAGKPMLDPRIFVEIP